MSGAHIPRVLIVDDRPGNLRAMEASLAPLGYPIDTASSGEEALRRMLQCDYAVLLVDVEMPGLDGFELAALIRQRPKTAHVPIIFITAAQPEANWILRGYAQGAVDCLVKPVDPLILQSKVSAFAELHRRGELIQRQAEELVERRLAEERAQRAAEFDRQLVAIVSHDIRSPLSAILATAQVQLRGGELGPSEQRAFERVTRSAERINQIVEVLLDFTRARVGTGIPVEPAPLCLLELSRRVVDEFAAVHVDRPVRLDCALPRVEVECDGPRMAQVLSNLLENAARYGTPGTPIDLRLESDGNEVVLEVHNAGPEIPEERRARLFEPFQGVDPNTPGTRKGLGLGLFIVKEIVSGHSGTVEVRSEPGEGTTFRVVVPQQPSASRTAEGGSSPCHRRPGRPSVPHVRSA